MNIVKVWMLDSSHQIDKSDMDFCICNNIQIEYNRGSTQTIEYSGQVYQFQGSVGFVKLTTVDQKSEIMLQLRYADKVMLINQSYAV